MTALTVKPRERQAHRAYLSRFGLDHPGTQKIRRNLEGHRESRPHAHDPSARISLASLRAYLVLMMLLVLFRVLDLARMFGR